MNIEARLPATSFDGATAWINTQPLDPSSLRGQVVLVDFWTLTCVNWLRTAPHVRAWSKAYGGDGLVVVGVHTPEFSFEHDVDRVRRAVRDRAIDFPVAVDNDYAIWRAFANHYWPALYFLDRDGILRDVHYGEGEYVRCERSIQRLLGVDRKHVSAAVEGRGVEAEADWQHLRSPETYLGHWRSERFSSPGGLSADARRSYELPERLRANYWALEGEWTTDGERLVLEEAGGSLAHRFAARDAHMVLASGTDESIPFSVRLDDEAPGPAHGVDVDEDGHGILEDARLYHLVRNPDVGERTLSVTFHARGAEAYSLTFG